jgi:hypothetical protein
VQYVTTISDAAVPGITAAKNAYNASLPATIESKDANGATILDAAGHPVMVANQALLPSETAYLDFVLAAAVNSWGKQYAAVTVAPDPAPAVINGVPQEVTRRQAIQALILTKDLGGVAYKDKVQPAINSIVDLTQRAIMQAEYDDSQTFVRTRPALVQMAAAIGLTTAKQIDDLFVFAATL